MSSLGTAGDVRTIRPIIQSRKSLHSSSCSICRSLIYKQGACAKYVSRYLGGMLSNTLPQAIAKRQKAQGRVKRCAVCGRCAALTFCALLSTIGETPRRQMSARTVAFCVSCLQAFCDGPTGHAPQELRRRLSEALTALTTAPTRPAHPQDSPVNPGPSHQGRRRARSCGKEGSEERNDSRRSEFTQKRYSDRPTGETSAKPEADQRPTIHRGNNDHQERAPWGGSGQTQPCAQ